MRQGAAAEQQIAAAEAAIPRQTTGRGTAFDLDPITGKLLFAKGLPITVGSGEMSVAEAEYYFQNPSEIVGHVVKTTASSKLSAGALQAKWNSLVGNTRGRIVAASLFTTQTITADMEKIQREVAASIPAQVDFMIGSAGGQPVRTPYHECVLIMPSRRLGPGLTAVRLGRFVD